MRDGFSAYAALGLEPGADRAAVEQAYRRLIKLHHPDRSGGDAARAAEINRAYFELRRQGEADHPAAAPVRPRPRRARSKRRRRRSRLGPVLVLALAALAFMQREQVAEQAAEWVGWLAELPPGPAAGRGAAARADSAALDGPLEGRAVAGSIERAVRLARSGGEDALAQHSRACHRRLRADPGIEQLDRCAAFDDAVAAIADRDPMTDSGVFSVSAVTARQMTAGRLLSSDYLAIGRRLDRIRTAVELALTPRTPMPAPASGDERV